PSSNPVEYNIRAGNGFYTAFFSRATITTITSDPPGAQVTVDGVTAFTPRNFAWTIGSSHSVSIASQQTKGGDTIRLNFKEWSNGGARSQTVTASSRNESLTALVGMQYEVIAEQAWVRNTSFPSPGSRNLVINPSNADVYYDAGSEI